LKHVTGKGNHVISFEKCVSLFESKREKAYQDWSGYSNSYKRRNIRVPENGANGKFAAGTVRERERESDGYVRALNAA